MHKILETSPSVPPAEEPSLLLRSSGEKLHRVSLSVALVWMLKGGGTGSASVPYITKEAAACREPSLASCLYSSAEPLKQHSSLVEASYR